MNMRGKVQTATFGTQTLEEYDGYIRQCASELGVEVEIFHSNIEGEVVNRLYEAHDSGDVDATLFNPAAYSSGHPGILAAIAQVDFPVYEIHISNPAARGGQSQVAGVCRGVITGFGLMGYQLGMRGVLDSLSSG
jgi:3-dehydroquinate dehydratase-2